MAFDPANSTARWRSVPAVATGPDNADAVQCSTAILPATTPSAAKRKPTVTGNADGGQPENRAFYPALDGLRWFAFTLVFLAHYLQMPWGFGGVNFFFVISGFLITGILLDTEHHQFRIRNFYVRRTLRIFPLYYALFAVLLLTTPFFHWQWSKYWIAWPLYLGNFLKLVSPASSTQTIAVLHATNAFLVSPRFPSNTLYMGAFWSLCVEEQFYLVWPWLVYACRTRARLFCVCLSTVVGVLLLRLAVQAFGSVWVTQQSLLYFLTPFRIDGLVLGATLALVWRSSHRRRLQQVVAWLAPVLAGVTVLYLLRFVSFHLDTWLSWQPPTWAFTWGFTWIDLLAGCALVLCLNPKSLVARVFNFAPLRALGRLTYGAYIFHDLLHPSLLYLARHMYNHYSFTAVYLLSRTVIYALTFAAAWLSFRYLETPFLRLKDRYTRHG